VVPKFDDLIQKFEIIMNKENKIIGNHGTEIIFPTFCFGDSNDTIIIELKECFGIKDMICNGLTTRTVGGENLETDGMIYINALNINGDTLKIINDLTVKMLTKKRKLDMKIFKGKTNQNGYVEWIELDDCKIKNFKIKKRDTMIAKPLDFDDIDFSEKYSFEEKETNVNIETDNLLSYIFQISELGWINCDRYIEGETQDLLVNVSKEQENVSLYLVLDELNSNVVPRAPRPLNGQLKFANIPLKTSFTLVALTRIGGKNYFGISNHITNKKTINCPKLKDVNRQELTDALLDRFGENIWNRPR
jgi:hypothetical protein